jgi:ATP-dependent Clp protease ATP-binding subunit ClpA
MSPTPNLQDLVQSVRTEVSDNDPLGQLSKAAELSGELSELGDRLLDHFVLQCRQAGMSWAEVSAALGVSKQAAHKRFTGATPNFQRFTVKAREVVQGSIHQARTLGHDTVGTEHLLVAMFTPADSLAAIALSRLGVREQDVLEHILEHKPRRPEQPTGPIPFDDNAKGVLRSAVDEAINLDHNYIGTEHLLLALYSQPDYASAQILGALGQNSESVRSTLLDELQRFMHERAKLRTQTE